MAMELTDARPPLLVCAPPARRGDDHLRRKTRAELAGWTAHALETQRDDPAFSSAGSARPCILPAMHSLAFFRRAGRRTSRASLALVCAAPGLLTLAACGGGSSMPPPETYAGLCAMPRTGIDPGTGSPYPDAAGTVMTEKLWVRSWINDQYLWYREVPASVDINEAATPIDYFAAEKTPAKTPSGKDKDQFHFVKDTAAWQAQSMGGVEAGYGVGWELIANKPPRNLVVAFIKPGSQADMAGLKRGAKITTIDNVDVENGDDVDTLNEGLSPTALNAAHTFEVIDPGQTAPRAVTLTSSMIAIAPVETLRTIDDGQGHKVGYLHFTDHIKPAEAALYNAFQTLSTDGVTDLILDMRYNGGGLLAIASELAYMIAGPDRTSGKTFETLSFNDKHNDENETESFLNASLGFVPDLLKAKLALPVLKLSRVFILTGADTCSASESVMNSLAGIDVQVIQIGDTTCGKPYGFLPADNCGTTYFAIQFQGVNQKRFGDYADGFVPGQIFPGCVVADDFGHALGDPAEARVAAALAYRANGSCPAAPIPPRARSAQSSGQPLLGKPAWRQNRIVLPTAPRQ
jgi:carboxyl-terminal processing protease